MMFTFTAIHIHLIIFFAIHIHLIIFVKFMICICVAGRDRKIERERKNKIQRGRKGGR